MYDFNIQYIYINILYYCNIFNHIYDFLLKLGNRKMAVVYVCRRSHNRFYFHDEITEEHSAMNSCIQILG